MGKAKVCVQHLAYIFKNRSNPVGTCTSCLPKLSHLFSKYLLRFQTYTWAHFILNFRSDLRGSSYTQNHYRASIAVVSYTHRERQSAGLLWHLGPRQFRQHHFPLPLRSSPLEFLPVCCFQLLHPLFPANLWEQSHPQEGSPMPRGWDTGRGKECWPLSQSQEI